MKNKIKRYIYGIIKISLISFIVIFLILVEIIDIIYNCLYAAVSIVSLYYGEAIICSKNVSANGFSAVDTLRHTIIPAIGYYVIVVLSFACAIICYLNNLKYIVVSNEASANEGNIAGTTINHQYSKSYEFEKDFNGYLQTYLCEKMQYFSLLRCMHEFQIVQFNRQIFRTEHLFDSHSPFRTFGFQIIF
mgnify:CR=1 FL=1